ncbi:hypothetical protein NIES4071_19470 [Calothrix sp. NIES-4071]|nr:hypothetical protein NIES4071_19470 [Calothrix sp. NIES-4071]BAZ56280.1 hypothetical protein NIES4105_19420 [Calothrix sp. NIES-4105]
MYNHTKIYISYSLTKKVTNGKLYTFLLTYINVNAETEC